MLSSLFVPPLRRIERKESNAPKTRVGRLILADSQKDRRHVDNLDLLI